MALCNSKYMVNNKNAARGGGHFYHRGPLNGDKLGNPCPLSASKLSLITNLEVGRVSTVCSVFDLAGLRTEPATSARHNSATTLTQPCTATPLVLFSATCLIASLSLL
jgi:hypothetical protein